MEKLEPSYISNVNAKWFNHKSLIATIQQFLFPGKYKGNDNICPHKYLSTNVHKCITYNSQNWGETQVFINL